MLCLSPTSVVQLIINDLSDGFDDKVYEWKDSLTSRINPDITTVSTN